MKKQKIFTILVLFITFIAVLYAFHKVIIAKIFAPTTSTIPSSTLSKIENDEESKDIEIIADNLNIPWEVAFLPSGEILVTERSGQLLKIGTDKIVIEIEGVTHVGEDGLLGMALHPNFKENNWIYLYLTTENNFILTNKVERYKFINNNLTEKTEILSNIPASGNHDGGRIAFGPDGYLHNYK